eukprot:IDg3747t1
MSVILSAQRELLMALWKPEEIDYIEQDHASLLEEYRNEDVFKNIINGHDERTTFKDSWSAAPSRAYRYLLAFLGSLETVFFTTSTVEINFFIVKWERMRPIRA